MAVGCASVVTPEAVPDEWELVVLIVALVDLPFEGLSEGADLALLNDVFALLADVACEVCCWLLVAESVREDPDLDVARVVPPDCTVFKLLERPVATGFSGSVTCAEQVSQSEMRLKEKAYEYLPVHPPFCLLVKRQCVLPRNAAIHKFPPSDQFCGVTYP